jgi:putative membrane protein
MSHRSIVFGVALLAAAGCSRSTAPQPDTQGVSNAPPAAQPMPEPTAAANPTPAPAAAPTDAASKAIPLTDPQIAAITDDANSAEIAQAKLAEQKAKDPRVKRFAEKMVKHHSEAKEKQAKLKLQIASSPASMDLEKGAASTLSTLTSASGSSFDIAYMNAQVEEHQKVLDTINHDLLPNVKSQELKAYLEDIKPTVENHLKDAQRIQRKLSETASAAE